VIAVLINGPLGENNVSLLGIEQATEIILVRVIDSRTAVVLPHKGAPSLQNLTRLLSFGTAHGAALARVGASTESFATVHVQKDNLVPEIRIARWRRRSRIPDRPDDRPRQRF
jgi:hypothetical protein